MDLRVIKKLKENIKKNISIIDIEPGFEPFYVNADNIIQVFDYMKKYYEFSDMNFGLNYKVANGAAFKMDYQLVNNAVSGSDTSKIFNAGVAIWF